MMPRPRMLPNSFEVSSEQEKPPIGHRSMSAQEREC